MRAWQINAEVRNNSFCPAIPYLDTTFRHSVNALENFSFPVLKNQILGASGCPYFNKASRMHQKIKKPSSKNANRKPQRCLDQLGVSLSEVFVLLCIVVGSLQLIANLVSLFSFMFFVVFPQISHTLNIRGKAIQNLKCHWNFMWKDTGECSFRQLELLTLIIGIIWM